MTLVAFLRAINVGGRVVSMARLREIVSTAGFAGVETFIASGNVVFDGQARQAPAAERTIARALETALGYAVPTFVRTERELSEIAAHQPFRPAEVEHAATQCVGFLAEPLDAARHQRLLALENEADRFAVHGREIYWLSRVKQNDSRFSNVVFERAVGVSATFRGVNTIRRLSEKYPPSAPAKRTRRTR